MRASVVIPSLMALLMVSAASEGQTNSAGQPPGGWSAKVGHETFAFRDISRSGRPPDASPVTWSGDGPLVAGRYELARERSSHIGSIALGHASDFAYVTPSDSLTAPAADTASRLDIRYEYRRHLWRRLGADGVRLSAGVQAVGSRLAFERHTAAAASSSRIAGGGIAGMLMLDVSRWRRLHVYAEWANGGVISRRHTDHTADELASVTASGGNWLTDLSVGADCPLGRGLRLAAQWTRSASGYSSSHFSFSEQHRSWVIGAVYAR